MGWTKTGTFPAAPVTDAAVQALLAGATTSRDAVDTRVAAGVTGKVDKTYLSGVPVTFYGASLTDGPFNPPGGGWYTLLGAELGSGAVTTYGVGSMKTNHMLGSLVSAGTVPGLLAPKAGSVWPGVSARPGLVVNDGATTDATHYSSAASGLPTPITGAGGDRYLAAIKNQHQGVLAYESSEVRIEQTPSASVVYFGPWVNKALSMPYASGGSVAYTTTPIEAVTITVTAAQIAQSGPLAGRGWLGTFQLDPSVGANAPVDISIDGGTPTRWTPTEWETYVGLSSTDVNSTAAVIPFTLPTDGADHTISFQHAGASGAFFYFDCLIMASPNPPPRVVMGSHTPLGGSLWNAAQLTIWKNNWIKVEQKIREAVALFPNAIFVHSPLTAEGMQGNGLQDGFHLSNRGAQERRNDAAEAIRAVFAAYLRNHTSGDSALPAVPRKLTKYDIAGLDLVDNVPDALKPINAATQAAINASVGARFRAYISGRYYGPSAAYIPTVQGWGNGVQACIPFWVGAAFTADRISIEVTTAVASTVARLGIYNNGANDLPGTLLLDAGTIATDTTGVKEIVISQALAPGLYWLACVTQGVGTPVVRCVGNGTQPPVAPTTFQGSASTAGMNCYYQSGISGALANWPGTPVAGAPGPLVKLRAT